MTAKFPSVEHPTGRPNFYILTGCDGVEVAFSYDTPIGFREPGQHGWTVRVNDWAQTTGRHLNYLCRDKAGRVSGAAFVELLAVAS